LALYIDTRSRIATLSAGKAPPSLAIPHQTPTPLPVNRRNAGERFGARRYDGGVSRDASLPRRCKLSVYL